MKRASYRAGVRWIALNDEPCNLDEEEVAYTISALLLADLFEVEPERVGRDVVRIRARIELVRQSRAARHG